MSIKKKLYLYAFASTPLIALYGISPLYIFLDPVPDKFILGILTLTLVILTHWIVILNVLLKTAQLTLWKRYALSVLASFALQFVGALIRQQFTVDDRVKEFFLYPIVLGFAITAVILIICNSILLAYKAKGAETLIEQLKIEKLESQKQVLMQQLQPHFLFNSISVLKSLIRENIKAAENYAVKLSNFLRYSVASHKNSTVTLKEELQFVADYVDLQKMRFQDSFYYELTIPEDVMDRHLPVYALQTLIENAFKHNYFTEKRPLRITVTYENDHIRVWNNKEAIRLTERSATGLANLNKRYQLITEKNIKINDTDTSFCVRIPLLHL